MDGMSFKRRLSIIIGALLLLLNLAAWIFLMPDTVKDQHDLMSGKTLEKAEKAEVSATPTPTASPSEESAKPTARTDGLPNIDISSWEYRLVNAEHSIGEYAPVLADVEEQKLDQRIAEPMKEFIAAARDQGLSVFLSSGYRSYYEQEYLFNRKAQQYGVDEAAKIVSRPGTSEHQTGLACDITDQYYEVKTESLEETALYQWMSKHCYEYGFIVRYPKDKEEITGIIYEPWHFRYVGKEAAKYMYDHNLCLEEFVALYE